MLVLEGLTRTFGGQAAVSDVSLAVPPGSFVDSFFKSPVSGGHTQSVLGVLNGTYDAAFTWTTKEDGYGQIRTMIDKGMLKRDQIRIVWESSLVPPPPVI